MVTEYGRELCKRETEKALIAAIERESKARDEVKKLYKILHCHHPAEDLEHGGVELLTTRCKNCGYIWAD